VALSTAGRARCPAASDIYIYIYIYNIIYIYIYISRDERESREREIDRQIDRYKI